MHGSKEHCLDIAKLLRQAKKKGSKDCPFINLFRKRGITFWFTSSLSIVLSNIIELGTSSYI